MICVPRSGEAFLLATVLHYEAVTRACRGGLAPLGDRMVPAIFSGHFWRIPLWRKQPDMADKIVTLISRQIRRTPFAAIRTCAYILGFAAPFEWDLPLIALAVFAFLSVVFNPGNAPTSRPALLFPVMFFVVSVGASTFVSINATWSLFLSVSLLPAGLIYFLVAGQFYSFRHVRMLFVSFATLSFAISVLLIIQALRNLDGNPTKWISDFASPILVVPNDIALLAVISPLSIALLYCERDSLIRTMAVASVLLSAVAISIFQSRTGILTMVVSTTACLWFIRPRLALICGASIVTFGFLVDGLLGFPLLAKLGQGISNTRLSLWLAAWNMFLDAPLLGHGPHTYGLLLQSYVYDLDLPNWEPLANLVRPWPEKSVAPWPHNLFLEILAEQGVIGLVALSALLVSALRLGWKLRESARNHVRIYGIAAASALLGFCFAGILELTFMRLWVTIAMFSLVAVLACLSRPEAMEHSGESR